MDNKPLGRASLKSIFRNGSRPNESNFSSLIDSVINKVDDGISKNIKDGLIIAPESDESDRLVSFYEKINHETPSWSIELENGDSKGLSISETENDSTSKSRIFLEKDGNTGINTQTPRTDLEVDGILGMKNRVGTYKLATVPADGKWHDVITNLNGCQAFEIIAQVGKEKTGKYALAHAHAISTFGKSRSKIKMTQAHYGWCWNKISLRWKGSTFKYKLQIRTRSNYGNEQIKFSITNLWNNDILSLFEEQA